jgi:hypothetical protein
MPKITGQSTDPLAVNQSIADSLKDVGDGMFRPLDPLTRERMAAEQRHTASRAKAAEALGRGDMTEYLAQSYIANKSADDAIKYAGAAGYNIIPTREGNRNLGTDGYPVPRYVPQPSAPDSAPLTPATNTAPQPAPAPAATAPAAVQPAPSVSTFTPLAPAVSPPVPRVNFFPGPRAPRPFAQSAGVSPF